MHDVSAKSDADDPRVSHERLSGLLGRTDFGAFSAEDRIAMIRSMEFPEFRAHLVRINGVLRGIPVKDRGHDYRDGLRVVDADDPDNMRIDYRAPRDGWRFLEDFFFRMREDLSAWNLAEWGAKLRYAVFFAHAFSDGNKRTARYMERIVVTGGVDAADAASPGGKTVGFSEANKLAVFAIVKDELPAPYRSAVGDSLGNLPDLAHFVSGAYADFGYAVPLEALALILSVPELSPIDLLQLKKRVLWQDKNRDLRDSYDGHYHRLQERLFWEVQKLLDREMPGAEQIDEIFRSRVLVLLARAKRP